MSKVDAHRLLKALQAIAEAHPQRLSFMTEMIGQPGIWRARKGESRAVFRITDAELTVIAVGHRREIYR